MVKYRKKIILFTLFAMNLIDQPTPEVKIKQGTLTGKISTDGLFYEYNGIPYASTIGRRFQAPGPPPSWEGVFRAVDDIYMCPQSTSLGILGNEDCLKINVYAPAMAKKPLPVMVWIHGGAFVMGSGGKILYTPDFLVNKDVILVTFNYRLGALGFLCLGIKEAPGNAGLKDQVAALRWVKENIAAFGGDPNSITLFGESAGAASISFLLVSESTNGLFDRVILQSGSSLSNWALNRKPVRIASLLANELGYNTTDPKELYNIFYDMNYKDIIGLSTKNIVELFYDTQLLHLPCVEKFIPGVEPIITDLPFNLFTKTPKNVPMIFGSNSREGLFVVSVETEESLNERNGRYLFASDLHFPSVAKANATAEKVQKFYFGEDKVSKSKAMNVSELYTHLYFEIPTILEVETLLDNIKSSVYNYIFDYSGGRNFLKKDSGFPNEPGACHGDDLAYLFNGYLLTKKVTENDRKIINFMTTMWTNFAKYGDPTPQASELPIRWEPSTKNNLRFLYIDSQLRMGPMPNPNAYRLWKDIYDNFRKTFV